MSLVSKPKDIFRNVVVATAGDLGKPGFNGGGVQRYVASWGGRFSDNLDDSVTHLLVSQREMKAKTSHPRGKGPPTRRRPVLFSSQKIYTYTHGRNPPSPGLPLSLLLLLPHPRSSHALTHLLTVREGQKRRKLEIVTADWLEDSINKKKKQPAKPYSLVRMRKEAKAAKKRELNERKNIEKAGYFMNPGTLVPDYSTHLIIPTG